MAHADECNLLDRTVWGLILLVLPRPVIKARDQLVQIGTRSDAVDGHDFDHAPVLLAVKYGTELQLLHFQRLYQQFFRLNRVAEHIVVVNVM
ncbi:hypothetical protein SDC9_175865 [bioreactor metagenome]|uniref:Uncharacterized protein n=1 Tax=bioreactor metagenome TaxID=1076179 RepID=A0A645GWL8_9ZZZZ